MPSLQTVMDRSWHKLHSLGLVFCCTFIYMSIANPNKDEVKAAKGKLNQTFVK